MDDCKFCNGEPIPAEEFVGNGVKTMSMMLDLLFGYKAERTDMVNGIQLKNGNLLCFDNSACEYTILGIRINNCPFCGKKLQQKDGENDG